MHKRNTNHSNYQHCCICFPIDDQVISITDALFKQIQKFMQQTKKDCAQYQCSKLEPIDFSRLLKMIFSKRFKNLKATTNCRHSELKKNFMDRLACSSKQIDKISSNLSWKIAKFNFHTDVVLLQSKSFLRHLTKGDMKKQSSKSQTKNKVRNEIPKYIKQQNQQKNSEQIIQASNHFSKLGIVVNPPEPNLEQYQCVWNFWQPSPIIYTRPDYMGGNMLKCSQIPTFQQIQQF